MRVGEGFPRIHLGLSLLDTGVGSDLQKREIGSHGSNPIPGSLSRHAQQGVHFPSMLQRGPQFPGWSIRSLLDPQRSCNCAINTGLTSRLEANSILTVPVNCVMVKWTCGRAWEPASENILSVGKFCRGSNGSLTNGCRPHVGRSLGSNKSILTSPYGNTSAIIIVNLCTDKHMAGPTLSTQPAPW